MNDILTDPSMKDVVDDFCAESASILGDLEDLLTILEENPSDLTVLEQFGQNIDRIMGAAKSIGAKKTGIMCELGKIIGYKTSQAKLDGPLQEITVAILFDCVDLLNQLIAQIKNGKGEEVEGLSIEAFVTRLKWLSEKFAHIDRSSVIADSGPKIEPISQSSIESLIKDLGL